MKYDYLEYASLFKVLADETRLKIIDMLSCGELCACKILESFKITQPTLSYHMKILCDSGLVSGRRDGIWMNYSINSELLDNITAFLTIIKSDKDECICKEDAKSEIGEDISMSIK